MPTETVCFVIESGGLTRIARDFVSEGNWREAVELLTKNLRPNFTHEMAVEVLSGKKKLIGDSTKGMGLAPEKKAAVKEYLEQLGWMYRGIVRLRSHGLYMQPYAKVTSWGEHDLGGGPAGTVNKWCTGSKTAYPAGSNCPVRDPVWRSLLYMDDPSLDRGELLKVEGKHTVVLWKTVPMPPLWIKTAQSFQTALDEWLEVTDHYLGDRGACSEESTAYRNSLDDLLDDDEDVVQLTGVPATDDDMLDSYLKDPDGTMAKLTKRSNQAISCELGEPAGEELYTEENNGWLSPDGKFVSCKYGLHTLIAPGLSDESNAEYDLEKLGWVKLTKGKWLFPAPPMKRQRDAIMNWFTDRGEKTPKDVLERLE